MFLHVSCNFQAKKNVKKNWPKIFCPEAKIFHRGKIFFFVILTFLHVLCNFQAKKKRRKKCWPKIFYILFLMTIFFHVFYFPTCFMQFPSKKTKEKKFWPKIFQVQRSNFFIWAKDFFFVIFTFQDLTRNFQPKKMEKKLTKIYSNFNARIQNFEILISRDDEYYLEDYFMKNSASR